MPFEIGDPNINRKGRKVGSKGKKTIPKPKEIEDEIQRHGIDALKIIVAQMEDKKEKPAIRQKNAMWLAEQFFTIEDMKKSVAEEKKAQKDKSKEQETPKEETPAKSKAAVLSLTAVP